MPRPTRPQLAQLALPVPEPPEDVEALDAWDPWQDEDAAVVPYSLRPEVRDLPEPTGIGWPEVRGLIVMGW